ncbi:MAG: ABC transporter permease [Trueperaceae bacterium]|nr:MAG: ABC transporter permease [Trueperaceae bacterium]
MRISRLFRYYPIVVTVCLLILLGYPFALIFGLPLARRDMRDLRKWETETVIAAPPSDIEPILQNGDRRERELEFSELPASGVLVLNERPLHRVTSREGERSITVPMELLNPELVVLSEPLERSAEGVYTLNSPFEESDGQRAIYAGDRLLVEGAVEATEPPDGKRTRFTFERATGPVIIGPILQRVGEDYLNDEGAVIFMTPPAFGSSVRRIDADFAVLDADTGSIAIAKMPVAETPLRIAKQVVRLAEQLSEVRTPVGDDRTFRFSQGNLVENDRERKVYVGARALRNVAERPRERVSGEQSTFTFDSFAGIISLDGVVQIEGRDFTRNGQVIGFLTPPPRNAKLRQNPDYFLTDASAGEILLNEAPASGEIVWTDHYNYYDKPGCGQTLLECFYALPQHPVPYPHWIAKRFGPFVSKFPLSDERNVIRSTAYTTLGTLGALALGGAVGILLAVLFVLFRPLEQALFPWVIASQTVPIIALVPVLLLILGNFGITIQTSILPTAIIGAYIAFFPVTVGTVKGLRSVEPLALDLMKTYAASPLQVFLKIRFPAAIPFFFTSLKLGTAASLVGALVAETESNNRRGLGFQILGQVQSGNVADVWILLIISSLLGIGLVAFIGLIERFFTPWKRV